MQTAPELEAYFPPAMLEETPWDILLALHSDPTRGISLERLAPAVSVHPAIAHTWLSWLEERKLVTGLQNTVTGEIRALLTDGGRELLDRYLSATIDLHARTH